MNVKTGLTLLAVVMLLAFSTHSAVASVTLAVQDIPVQAGSSDVPVPITISSDELLAGASFTVSYSEELTFLGVSSTYFDTFLAQGFSSDDLVPCDLDNDNVLDPGECDPDGNNTPDDDEFFEQPLIVSADDTVVSGKKEIMIAAARVDIPNPVGTDTIILTVNFDTPLGTEAAEYEVDIKRSQIQINVSAGYDSPTVIPMLVGFDDTQTAPADKYPEIAVSNVPVHPDVLAGTLTVTDGDLDSDDIPDQWELAYVPPGTPNPLDYFSKTGDKDKDGYTDYQEYLNRNATDPLGADYDPNVTNAPDGMGYEPASSSAMPAILLLLLDD